MKPIPGFTHALVHPGIPDRTPEETEKAMAEARAMIDATPWNNTARPSEHWLAFVRGHGIPDATDAVSAEKRKLAILHAGLVQQYDADGR